MPNLLKRQSVETDNVNTHLCSWKRP